jgi:uncharacterized protein
MSVPRSRLVALFAICSILTLVGTTASAADTRLADAAQKSDAAAVRALIKQKASVNTQQVDGMTALLWAAHNDDIPVAELLVKAGADVNLANRYGILPLAEAATNGSAPMIELLLKAGADANATLAEGDTMLLLAARAGNTAAVKALLDKGAKVDEREAWHGDTPLAIAAAKNNVETMKLLLEHGADPNAATKHLVYPNFKMEFGSVVSTYPEGGLTPLMQAARDNSFEAAQLLLASKADPNLRDPYKMTAMQIAIMNAHWDMVKLLLDNGANADDGSLGLIVDIKNLKFVRPASNHIESMNIMDVIKLLLDRGAKPNTPMEANVPSKAFFSAKVTGPADATPLMRAAKLPDVPVMRLLIEHGADPKIVVKDGSTALMVSAGVGFRGFGMAGTVDVADQKAMIAAVQLCLDHGGDVNTIDSFGGTAVHAAAQSGYNDLVTFLAEKGAKLDVKDKRGRTPYDIAKDPGKDFMGGALPPHPDTAALIRKLMGLPEEDKAAPSKSSQAAPAGENLVAPAK